MCFTFIRCSWWKATGCGDVIIFMLRVRVLDLLHQWEVGRDSEWACWKWGCGCGRLGEEGVWDPQSRRAILGGKVQVGAVERRARQNILKVQRCSACWRFWKYGEKTDYVIIYALNNKVMPIQLTSNSYTQLLPAVLVLGSGELCPSWGWAASLFPLEEGVTLFCSTSTLASPPSVSSPFLKYFCSHDGTMLFTVSVTRLIRPGCCSTKQTDMEKSFTWLTKTRKWTIWNKNGQFYTVCTIIFITWNLQ